MDKGLLYLEYGVSYDHDLDKAKDLAIETVKVLDSTKKDKRIHSYSYNLDRDTSLRSPFRRMPVVKKAYLQSKALLYCIRCALQ